MKTSVHHERFGDVEYQESAWSGKREISIGGVPLEKKTKKEYVYHGENGMINCRIKGNAVMGATLLIGSEEIRLTPSPKWYECVCSLLIFCFVLAWGNNPVLCSIFPIVGGAIGGGISGGLAYANLMVMKSTKRIAFKFLVWLGMFLGTVLICYLIALLILTAFA